MALKDEVEHLIAEGEQMADAEFRKAVTRLLALFHNHVSDEKVLTDGKPEVPNQDAQIPVEEVSGYEIPDEEHPQNGGGPIDGTGVGGEEA